MQTARVIGTATATVKHSSMQGAKLLIVQPLQVDGRSPDGEPVLAVDRLGAGSGETVLITSDGRAMRELLNCESTPVRWSVFGLPDYA
jgi:ethanolamine utilization protein EutN